MNLALALRIAKPWPSGSRMATGIHHGTLYTYVAKRDRFGTLRVARYQWEPNQAGNPWHATRNAGPPVSTTDVRGFPEGVTWSPCDPQGAR